MGSVVLAGVAMLGVLLVAGCGQVGSSAPAPGEEPTAEVTQATRVPQSTEVKPTATGPVRVGISEPSAGPIEGSPLVPRDASGNPIPQTPVLPVTIVLTPDASGSVRLTDDSQVDRVELRVGDTLELAFSDMYDWTVDVTDNSVLASAQERVPGNRLFKAQAAGQVTIDASGDPTCRKLTPPCGMPSRGMNFLVVVR